MDACKRPAVIAGRRLLALLLVIAFGGCTRLSTASPDPSGSGRPEHPWTEPGVVRMAVSTSPNTLDPLLTTQQIESALTALVFDPLVATGPDGNDVPVLASRVPTLENGDIARDGRTITYHLRHGVKWHDGAPFTSRDVRFTWQAIMNPNTAITTRHGYDLIEHVDIPDPYTAVFRLKEPFAPAVHTFFGHSDAPYDILPEHLLARYHDLNRIPFNDHPVGTGPFTFVRWARGDRLEFAANDAYALGKPKLRRIVVRMIPDENTIVDELRSHEIDAYLTATPRIYPQIRALDGVAVHLVPFNGYDAIMIETRRAPFDDVRVRRAVALALDKHELVDKITFGTTVAATVNQPPLEWAYDPSAGTDRRDLAKANALLDAAGFRRGPNGIRERKGVRLAPVLAYRSDSLTDRQRSVIIAAMLHDAGFDVTLKGYTTALLYGPIAEHGVLSSGNYDLGLETWYAGIDPDDSSQLLCSEVAPKGYNWTRFCDPTLDAAEHVALSHYDRPTRKRAYSTVQHILADQVPFVFLWWPRQIEAVNDDLHGFRPNGIVDTWNAYEWSI